MTATTEPSGLRAGAVTPAQAAALAYVRAVALRERHTALTAIARELATRPD
ncbi:hypothetical protein O7634_23790 [Micromonospora sp. WMMD1120]|uniref:hypothetical protein n=1 Tax=Micromonospora sp. WMMD1120 TaxID=3016106 RepID=UPI002415E967|nr:hypothetical protein [Micromonospora sp. WMMD1120]MDG4809785.1 hypothetical protein [Micromonospora sp. WMMD1120]